MLHPQETLQRGMQDSRRAEEISGTFLAMRGRGRWLTASELQTASGRVCVCETQPHMQLGQPDSIPIGVKLLEPTGSALSLSASMPTHHFLFALSLLPWAGPPCLGHTRPKNMAMSDMCTVSDISLPPHWPSSHGGRS